MNTDIDLELRVKLINLLHKHGRMVNEDLDQGEKIDEMVERLVAERDEARKKQPINTSLRLFDLVRFMRSELLHAKLIDEREYFWLCHDSPMAKSPKGGSPSRERLEEYDEMSETIKSQHVLMVNAEERGIAKGREEAAAQITALRAELEEAKAEVARLMPLAYETRPGLDIPPVTWAEHSQDVLRKLYAVTDELAALRAAPRSETEGRDKERLDWLEANVFGLKHNTEGTKYCGSGEAITIRALIDAALAHDEKGAGE